MEPDDIPVHDLLGVGGEPDPGPNELRAIVARAGRKRWATAGIAATLALALGLGIGFVTAGPSTSPANQTATGASASGQNPPSNQNATGNPNASNGGGGNATPSATSGGATSSGASTGGTSSSSVLPQPIAPERFTRLFTRTAGGITIRGFLVTFPQIFGVSAACQIGTSHLQVEVSTPGMVGTVAGGLVATDRTQPISAFSSQVVGTAEGNPTVVVTAATGSGIAKMSMSFGGGRTDAMAPVDGWVALAAPVASSVSYGSNLGTITARDAAGKLLESQPLRLEVQSSTPASSGCSVMCPDRPQTGAAPKSTAANSASTPAQVACPPLPCTSTPTVTVPANQTPSTGGATAVNPGGAMIPPTGTGAASHACTLPAPAGGGASGSSGVSP